jgi:hypothetical protein
MKIIHKADPAYPENPQFIEGHLYRPVSTAHKFGIFHCAVSGDGKSLTDLNTGKTVLNCRHSSPGAYIDVTTQYTLVHNSFLENPNGQK